MELDPAAVALKFGFSPCSTCSCCGWPARPREDLRRGGGAPAAYADDAARRLLGGDGPGGDPKLRVETAAGLRAGSARLLRTAPCSGG